MRIHWSIVTITALFVILLTWHFRTREIDFMTPRITDLPPEDFANHLASGSNTPQPKIEGGPKPGDPVAVLEAPPEEPEIPEISKEDLGDLEASPGLDTYREFARQNDAARLFLLSSTLRTQGEFQRALLALERVIDSTTTVTPEELHEAGQGISALTPTLPRWNIDPGYEVRLILEVGIPRADDEDIKQAILEMATLIRSHSGDLLEIIPKISSPKGKVEIENPPVTLRFSSGGEHPASSATMTVTAGGGDDETTLLDRLSLAIFKSIRAHLAKRGYRPADPLPETPGTDLLTLRITRLMWSDFAKSLVEEPSNTAEEKPEKEN